MMDLIKKIVKAPAISGREQAVAAVIRSQMEPLCDEVYLDKMNNLIAVKRGTAPEGERKKIMLAAHMDEIGFLVNYIEDNGFIRMATIGGISFAASAYSTVVFANGVKGVLVPEAGTAAGSFAVDKFYVDIGAKDKKDAERRVKIGDYFVVEPNVTRLAGRRIAGRPLDDRIGCVVLVEVARRLTETRDDVYFVFTAQEEVGLRGAKTSAFAIAPDYAIAYDVTGTGDTIGAKPMAVKLGGGAAIKIKDASVLCNLDLVASLEQTAKENKIPYQLEVLASGGTDTASMQAAGVGCVAGAISIPTRYIHSSVETVDLGDVEACIALTTAWLSR
ncbi:MAG: M20/M25/M40 family metallo-hydrolase [Clostridia bacterium]|nr:M20/M25/M40 family metallo-hydrolase [Clostridia bacterium]